MVRSPFAVESRVGYVFVPAGELRPAVGVRRARPDAPPRGEHQRRPDPRIGPAVLLVRPRPRPADHPGIPDVR
jgi:hypothetical protein